MDEDGHLCHYGIGHLTPSTTRQGVNPHQLVYNRALLMCCQTTMRSGREHVNVEAPRAYILLALDSEPTLI